MYKILIFIAILVFSSVGRAVDVPHRGGSFFDTPERFNRYYTDPSYMPSRTIHVSPNGSGDGSAGNPMSVSDAFGQVTAGEEIRFHAGEYAGCWALDSDSSGTYDAPIVLKADPGVTVNCCGSGRATCFNLEYADYVAVDGFTLVGGNYGVRAVGGYSTSEHQKGIAVLNNHVRDQYKDPIFSGGSDWIVVENNIAHGAGNGDGHGIYLSNGSDWMIARNNELYDNSNSDFQINADPLSTCADEGIAFDDPLCDGSARNGLGQGVSEFVLVENNYFHDGQAQGPNLTSLRNSVFRNNIVGLYAAHGTSFWQETDNPKLGSSNNLIAHNLFIGESRWDHVLQLINDSTGNRVENNVFLGISRSGGIVTADDRVLLIQQDGSTEGRNAFAGNYFSGGYFEQFAPSATDQHVQTFNAGWYEDFPVSSPVARTGFRPTASAPFLEMGNLLSDVPLDMTGASRMDPADLGPWQITDAGSRQTILKDGFE